MRNTFHPIIAPIATTINEMFLRVINQAATGAGISVSLGSSFPRGVHFIANPFPIHVKR
jgi:hypothetical protein